MSSAWEMGEEALQLRTASEVKAELVRKGKTMAELAREIGYPRHQVYRVLAGEHWCKNLRGASHCIAVLLGIKEGEIT